MGKRRKKPRPLPWDLGLPPLGVETHAHLDLGDFKGEVDDLLDRAARTGIVRVGNVFLGPEAYARGAALFDNRPEVFFLLAIHPNEADTFTPESEAAIRKALADDGRIKAVGETGLDFYWDKVDRDVQERAFTAQLHLAREASRPVVIHCRDAEERTLEVLTAEGFRDYPLLWHCFGRDETMARRILDMGWHISVPGPVTYSKTDALRQAVAAIPIDRLMLETDCPFLAPEPYRGKRNEPAYMAFTAARVAEIKGMDPAEIWRACAENARAFFRL